MQNDCARASPRLSTRGWSAEASPNLTGDTVAASSGESPVNPCVSRSRYMRPNRDKFTPYRSGFARSIHSSRYRFPGREAMLHTESLTLTLLMIAWGVITAVLAVLVIYRATLSSREDDQIFIDAAEQHYYEEQQSIIARISSLTRPIIALAVVSGALLIACASVWLYQGYKSF